MERPFHLKDNFFFTNIEIAPVSLQELFYFKEIIMSIECICINDKNRPKEIPESKWIKEGTYYHVIYTVTVLPQKQLAFHLAEISLDECCLPYEYFLAHRFGFTEENLKLLMELIKDCSDTEFSIEELLEQTSIEYQ